MAAAKFNHRRVTPAEFSALLHRAGLSLTDFLYLTGRRRDQVETFLTGSMAGGHSKAGGATSFTPTMGDVMIVELAANDDGHYNPVVEDMFDIVARYDDGPAYKREKR